jgi:hypothetical protein
MKTPIPKCCLNPNPRWLLFILNRYGIRGSSVRLSPKQFSLEFSARIARTHGQILLVDSLELQEPATCFYWSTGRENRQPASICQQAGRMIQIRAIRKAHLQWVGRVHAKFWRFWFLLLDNAPISGSNFSSFLHILPLEQYKGWLSMKSKKTQIILQKMLVN